MSTDNTISLFAAAAAAVIDQELAFAREQDPDRFATLPSEFDDGKAFRRLVADYLPGVLRITLLAWGTRDGEDKVVQVFSTVAQGVSSGPAH